MNIYVGNLPLEMTEEQLRREFVVYGQVLSVTVMNDEYIGSGQSRGYGYVEMPSITEGNDAIISLEGKNINGQVINIVEALPLSDHNSKNSQYDSRKGSRFNRKGRERIY